MKAEIIIYPRPVILDPQGKAVCDSLGRLGFDQVKDVRVGKSISLELSTRSVEKAREMIEDICQKLLVNPLMEDYEIKLEGKPSA